MKSEEFKKLIDEHGIAKALETVKTTGQSLTEDFANEHKNMSTFSNQSTDMITDEIENEEVVESVSSSEDPSIQYESIFNLQTTHPNESTKKTLFAE